MSTNDGTDAACGVTESERFRLLLEECVEQKRREAEQTRRLADGVERLCDLLESRKEAGAR